MKFTLPGLAQRMAERGLDVDDLAAAARDAGKPVSADTVRKAIAGKPVMMTSATRIASVIESRPPRPGLLAVLTAQTENDPRQERPGVVGRGPQHGHHSAA